MIAEAVCVCALRAQVREGLPHLDPQLVREIARNTAPGFLEVRRGQPVLGAPPPQ